MCPMCLCVSKKVRVIFYSLHTQNHDIKYLAQCYLLMLRNGAAHLNICSNYQAMFRKVQSTEILFIKGYGALHLSESIY
jgi:hypothetical protein